MQAFISYVVVYFFPDNYLLVSDFFSSYSLCLSFFLSLLPFESRENETVSFLFCSFLNWNYGLKVCGCCCCYRKEIPRQTYKRQFKRFKKKEWTKKFKRMRDPNGKWLCSFFCVCNMDAAGVCNFMKSRKQTALFYVDFYCCYSLLCAILLKMKNTIQNIYCIHCSIFLF